MASAVSSTTSTTPAASAGSASTNLTPAQSQDQFLKLLVAQLNNQDPMNPMDNAQMTTQLAQINTVSGIQNLNQTVQSLVSQFSSMQMLQGASLVGKEVLSAGNSLEINGKSGLGAISLPSNASAVAVQILDAGGQVKDTINMGAKTAGNHTFTADLSKYSSTSGLTFKVIAANGSTAVNATTLMANKVNSIGSGANGLSLSLANGKTVDYSSVAAVM